jgi:molybdenum cofactor guanylyltransferase
MTASRDDRRKAPSSVIRPWSHGVIMAENSLPRVTGIILAGGTSRRMRRDKAFIDFDGTPLIARVLERVQPLCSETMIVANDQGAYAQFGVEVIGDVYPGKGSLGGLYSGLLAARESYVLAVACDMPFLNAALLQYLISLAPSFDVVIPRAHDPSGKVSRSARGERPADPARNPRRLLAKQVDLHPMHAVYSKTCLPTIQARLSADDLRLIGFLEDVRVRVVEPAEIDRFDPQHLSFFNANTPEDLAVARSLGHDHVSR